MGKTEAPSPSFKKYGVPFYAASWFPHSRSSSEYYVVLAGGGGEGRSGIPNAIVVSQFDLSSNVLSEQPVVKYGLESELPYRMVVHPRGDGFISALPQTCRHFEWEENNENESHKIGIKASDKVLDKLENVGQQLALAFTRDGSVLAAGGEDNINPWTQFLYFCSIHISGTCQAENALAVVSSLLYSLSVDSLHPLDVSSITVTKCHSTGTTLMDGILRVLKWPSMEIILEDNQAHKSYKDLCFSSEGKFLISLGSGGPARVWDVTSSASVATLAKENDEIFTSCRFSPVDESNQILYIAAKTDKGGSIVTWNTSSWKRILSKHVFREPICSFDVSPDGKFLAAGTAQGDVLLIRSTNLRVHTMIKKAHLGIVTALSFSHDSRALVSASMDSSARVTLVEDNKRRGGGGFNMWIILLMILISIAVYFFMKNRENFPFFG